MLSAVAIGTSHGAYKFTRKPDGKVLGDDRIIEIHKRAADTHLVMHGSSSSADLQTRSTKWRPRLNKRGAMPVEEIQLGIQERVRRSTSIPTPLGDPAAIREGALENPDKFRSSRLHEACAGCDEESVHRPLVSFAKRATSSRFKV